MDRVLAVELDPGPTIASYNLRAQELGGTAIQLWFNGIAGRDPVTAGDFVALWQNQGGIPWGTKPCATQAITNTSPDGSWVFGHLSLGQLPYVVAYSVGSDPTGYDVAAVVPLGAGGNPGPLQAITLSTNVVGSTSLALSYTTPVGSTPQTFGHQILLVSGQSFLPSSQIVAQTKPSDLESDVAFFNNVTMVVGQWYTAAYLAGSSAANVAATVTFLVAQP